MFTETLSIHPMDIFLIVTLSLSTIALLSISDSVSAIKKLMKDQVKKEGN